MRARAAAAAAALAAATMVWHTVADAAEARIGSFEFSCTTPEGQTLKPKLGDIGGVFYTDLPYQREQCLETIKRKIALCRENVDFESNTKNEKHAGCLPIFEQQARTCIGHFTFERGKCDAGGPGADEAPLEPFGPNWLVTENQPCQVWNPSPEPGETMTWTGACVDGKASGRGRSVWRGSYDESTYEGGRQAGKTHGHGTVTWASGSRYEGGWRDGQKHGYGTYTWADGERYEGGWRDGQKHGYGTYTWADGERYEGEWRDGKAHGHGTYTWADGDAMTCEWRDDECVDGTRTWH